jgi:hypothetical protein
MTGVQHLTDNEFVRVPAARPTAFSLIEEIFSGILHGNRWKCQIEASDHLSSPLTALSRLFVP